MLSRLSKIFSLIEDKGQGWQAEQVTWSKWFIMFWVDSEPKGLITLITAVKDYNKEDDVRDQNTENYNVYNCILQLQ